MDGEGRRGEGGGERKRYLCAFSKRPSPPPTRNPHAIFEWPFQEFVITFVQLGLFLRDVLALASVLSVPKRLLLLVYCRRMCYCVFIV